MIDYKIASCYLNNASMNAIFDYKIENTGQDQTVFNEVFDGKHPCQSKTLGWGENTLEKSLFLTQNDPRKTALAKIQSRWELFNETNTDGTDWD